jgi:hypothetical protein
MPRLISIASTLRCASGESSVGFVRYVVVPTLAWLSGPTVSGFATALMSTESFAEAMPVVADIADAAPSKDKN